jgi:hypothetical protein
VSSVENAKGEDVLVNLAAEFWPVFLRRRPRRTSE